MRRQRLVRRMVQHGMVGERRSSVMMMVVMVRMMLHVEMVDAAAAADTAMVHQIF